MEGKRITNSNSLDIKNIKEEKFGIRKIFKDDKLKNGNSTKNEIHNQIFKKQFESKDDTNNKSDCSDKTKKKS